MSRVTEQEIADARTYLDDLIRRRNGRLRIDYEDQFGQWIATVKLRPTDGCTLPIGYTMWGPTQGEAVFGLAFAIQTDREGIRRAADLGAEGHGEDEPSSYRFANAADTIRWLQADDDDPPPDAP